MEVNTWILLSILHISIQVVLTFLRYSSCRLADNRFPFTLRFGNTGLKYINTHMKLFLSHLSLCFYVSPHDCLVFMALVTKQIVPDSSSDSAIDISSRSDFSFKEVPFCLDSVQMITVTPATNKPTCLYTKQRWHALNSPELLPKTFLLKISKRKKYICLRSKLQMRTYVLLLCTNY